MKRDGRLRQMSGPRVALRPLTGDDMPVIEPWYEEAASHVRGGDAASVQSLHNQLEKARASGRGDLLAICRRDDPAPSGLLDYRVGEPEDGWLTAGFVALAAGQRGRGYGSEAVRLLEAAAERDGWARRFRAGVAVRNGLGLYFWLRLGYRPLAPGGHGWPARGGIIWMAREEAPEPRT